MTEQFTDHVAHRPTEPIAGAVITVSDRCAAGTEEDTSGPLAVRLLAEYGVENRDLIVVPDEVDHIASALQEALSAGARIILTTGGTGISPRDCTPEATKPYISTHLDGLAHEIRLRGLKSTPLACLSRGLVGITARGAGGSLIVNAPGSNGGVQDTVEVLGPVLGHIIEQLSGPAHPKADEAK
ncbi:MAG: MogA/MoaB family molybdenum cofactor biosynthesis protein [Bowdeniella nasicola]|nr:MogA/MoaB family molybdenum cofactor biosynthesis protein [Bowdeniella nasicola]